MVTETITEEDGDCRMKLVADNIVGQLLAERGVKSQIMATGFVVRMANYSSCKSSAKNKLFVMTTATNVLTAPASYQPGDADPKRIYPNKLVLLLGK